MANPAEPHGLWGELYPAYVGGYVQAPNWNGGAAYNMNVAVEEHPVRGPGGHAGASPRPGAR